MCLVNSFVEPVFLQLLQWPLHQSWTRKAGMNIWSDKQKMKPVVQHFTNMQCQRFLCFSLCTRQVRELARTDMQNYWRLASGLWQRKLKSGGSSVCWGLGLEVEGCWFKTQYGQNHGASGKLPEHLEKGTEPTMSWQLIQEWTVLSPTCNLHAKWHRKFSITHHINVAILLKLKLSLRKTDMCSWGSDYTSQPESSNQ